jgi:hypothetical protein
MNDLKDRLIRLGSQNPSLQGHLEPIIDRLTKTGAISEPRKDDVSVRDIAKEFEKTLKQEMNHFQGIPEDLEYDIRLKYERREPNSLPSVPAAKVDDPSETIGKTIQVKIELPDGRLVTGEAWPSKDHSFSIRVWEGDFWSGSPVESYESVSLATLVDFLLMAYQRGTGEI